jgi:hypothetical protein
MERYRVVFGYADMMSGCAWRERECEVYAKDIPDARKKCMELYGLGVDCNHHIGYIFTIEQI